MKESRSAGTKSRRSFADAAERFVRADLDRKIADLTHALTMARQKIAALEATLEFARRRGEELEKQMREMDADTQLES